MYRPDHFSGCRTHYQCQWCSVCCHSSPCRTTAFDDGEGAPQLDLCRLPTLCLLLQVRNASTVCTASADFSLELCGPVVASSFFLLYVSVGKKYLKSTENLFSSFFVGKNIFKKQKMFSPLSAANMVAQREELPLTSAWSFLALLLLLLFAC